MIRFQFFDDKVEISKLFDSVTELSVCETRSRRRTSSHFLQHASFLSLKTKSKHNASWFSIQHHSVSSKLLMSSMKQCKQVHRNYSLKSKKRNWKRSLCLWQESHFRHAKDVKADVEAENVANNKFDDVSFLCRALTLCRAWRYILSFLSRVFFFFIVSNLMFLTSFILSTVFFYAWITFLFIERRDV